MSLRLTPIASVSPDFVVRHRLFSSAPLVLRGTTEEKKIFVSPFSFGRSSRYFSKLKTFVSFLHERDQFLKRNVSIRKGKLFFFEEKNRREVRRFVLFSLCRAAFCFLVPSADARAGRVLRERRALPPKRTISMCNNSTSRRKTVRRPAETKNFDVSPRRRAFTSS